MNDKLTQFQEKYSDKRISVLMNAREHFVNHILIVEYLKNAKYRLVVIHEGRILYSSYYVSIRAARIAFARMYLKDKTQNLIKNQWTDFYSPIETWLKRLLKEEL